MFLDFKKLKELFESKGMGDIAEYEEAYANLLKRKQESLFVDPTGNWGNLRRIREFALVLRQTYLHRSIKLFSGSLVALLDDNPYSMALSIRGSFETTAVLGYLHNRLYSFVKRTISPETLDKDLGNLLLGSRETGILKLAKKLGIAWQSKNVLSLLESAERSINTFFIKEKREVLTDCYKYLCEFSHPNFHSNLTAFELKKSERTVYFKHDTPMHDEYFKLIEYIMIATKLFISLFDSIDDLLPRKATSK